MKGKTLPSVLVATVVLAWSATDAAAQFREQELQFGALAGYEAFTKLGEADGSEVEATGAFAAGLTAAYYFNRNWGVRAAWTWSPADLEVGGAEVGGMNVYALDAALLYRFPMERLDPYVLAGAGGVTYDPDRDVLDAGLLGSGDVHTAFAPVFGAGLVWRMQPKFAMSLEVTDHLTFNNIDPDEFVDVAYDESTAHHLRFVGGFTITTGR